MRRRACCFQQPPKEIETYLNIYSRLAICWHYWAVKREPHSYFPALIEINCNRAAVVKRQDVSSGHFETLPALKFSVCCRETEKKKSLNHCWGKKKQQSCRLPFNTSAPVNFHLLSSAKSHPEAPQKCYLCNQKRKRHPLLAPPRQLYCCFWTFPCKNVEKRKTGDVRWNVRRNLSCQ